MGILTPAQSLGTTGYSQTNIMEIEKLIKRFAFMLPIAMLTACNNPSIEGSWLEPVPGMPDIQQGFTLENNGKASSINMSTLQYEAWEQKDSLLILSGKSIGNRQTISFSDTLIIEKLTDESLLLKRNQVSREYFRDKKEAIVDTIAEDTLTQVKNVLTVKGTLKMEHEVRSFTAEGDTVSYWIVDKTGKLTKDYDQITQGEKNGHPVYVELEVTDSGKSNEGFAADYYGVYQVVKINEMSLKRQ